MAKDIEFLKSVQLLKGLTNDELKEFFRICKKSNIKQGNTIMKEGETGDTMYLFQQGTVEVSHALTLKIGKKGFEETEKSMVKLNADHVNFFGDMSILSEAPRSATIKALTDCHLYEIKKDDFVSFCSMYPALGLKILQQIAEVLCERVRKGNEDILKLTTALSIALSK